MAAGAGSAVVGTQCNGSECAVLFVGALGVLPLVGGSLIVTGATAARARALGRRGVAVNSTLGWVAVGLATAGPVVTFVALGTEAWAIPVGIGMSAASLPLAVVQSVRNARAAKDAGLWAAPQLNTRAPGIMLGGHF